MPAASYLQPSFLGGEWSKYMQGRADREDYRSGLAVCRNAFPIEEGSWNRRPGFWWNAPTRKGRAGRVLPVAFSQGSPYNIELTDGHMRFFAGNQLVLESSFQIVTGSSAATPAGFTTLNPHGWTTGDEVQFFLGNPVVGTGDGLWWLWNRQYEITVTGSNSFSVVDPITGVGLDGATVIPGSNVISVSRVLDIVTPWTGTLWQEVHIAQDQDEALLMHPTVPTQVLKIVSKPNLITGAPAGFSLSPAIFQDGPFLDPPTDASTVTPSGTTGTITLTVGYAAYDAAKAYSIGDVVVSGGIVYTSGKDANVGHTPVSSGAYWIAATSPSVGINGGKGFLATDLGRQVRLFSEPLPWSGATAYAKNATVKYGGTYWSAIAANTNQQPDTQTQYWGISTTAAQWAWGTITTVTSGGLVSVQLHTPLLYVGAISVYQLGVWGDTLGYASSGTYHEGRFWLATRNVGNRLDSTMVNNGLVMSPTGPDGTVADDDGISALLQSTDVNTVYWLLATDNGIQLGTQAGEWTVMASQLADPITPTSIQAHRRTKFGCADVPPVHLPMAVAFVHRHKRKVFEYIVDPYSGKTLGTNLSLKGKHLTQGNLVELAYQSELAPVIWARMGDGSLAGCTYKRESPLGQQPASFFGWHRHDLGGGNTFNSISSGAAVGGDLDALAAVTFNSTTGVYWVNNLSTLFDEDTSLYQANFLDQSTVPAFAEITGGNVRFFGYYYLAGKNVDVFAAGLDLGTFTVTAHGTVDVPLASSGGNALFTTAFLASLTTQTAQFPNFSVKVNVVAQSSSQPTLTGVYNFAAAGDVGGVLPNWDAGTFVTKTYGTSTTFSYSIFTKYNLTGHSNLQAVPVLTCYPTAVALPDSSGYDFTTEIDALGLDGNIYWVYTAGNKSGPFMRAPYSSMVADGFRGTPSGANGGVSSTIRFDGSHMPSSGLCCTAETASGSWFVQSSSVGDPGTGDPASVIVANGAAMTVVYKADITEQIALPVRGPTIHHLGASTGVAYILGRTAGNVQTTSPSTLYSLSVADTTAVVEDTSAVGVVRNTIKTLHPADIVAGWNHFSSVNGLMYDATDKNVIGVFGTDVPATYAGGTTYGGNGTDNKGSSIVRASDGHDYVAHFNGNFSGQTPIANTTYWTDLGAASYTAKTYLVKLSVADGSVIWKLDWSAYNIPSDRSLALSRCTFGQWGFASGGVAPATFILVNTLTGAIVSTETVAGLTAGGVQNYDDTTGTLLFYAGSFDGSITSAPAPLGGADNLYSNLWSAFIGIPTSVTTYQMPAVIGYTYTSQGQLLRPLIPQEIGAANGPGLGKTRRTQEFACLMTNTGKGITFGADFTLMHAADFRSPGGTIYTALQLWDGVYWDKLEDSYSFDSMPAWQVTRPLPATVLSFEAFIHTQDR